MILVQVHATNPDPLQDFCMADISATAPHVNGFPCKLRSNVTAKDFLFTGLRTSRPGGYAARDPALSGTNGTLTLASVDEFPGLNTQGVSHVRLDFGIGGVFPLHNPLAAETLLVIKGSIYTGFISDDYSAAESSNFGGPQEEASTTTCENCKASVFVIDKLE